MSTRSGRPPAPWAPAWAAGLPFFGEPGADEAAAGFLDAVHGHAQRLAGAAEAGARSLRGYAVAFHQVGG
jgi:hypothetical protein